MRSGGAWLGLEAGAAKKYGLDPIKDGEFFEFVREWLEGEEFDPEAEGAFEEYDACVEYRAKVYFMGFERGKRASSPGASVGMIAKSTDQAGKDGKHAATQVELNDTDSTRHWALTEYLYKTAALERDVMDFRSEVLGGSYKTLSRSEALRRLEKAERPLDVPSVLVALPEGDFGRRFRVAEESEWGRLSGLAERLSRKYPWDEAQAAAFVLCGEGYLGDGGTTAFAPPVARVGYRESLGQGHAAHPYNRTVITLEAASWVPAEKVKEAYSKMQWELNDGKRVNPPSLRCIEVFRFVLENSTIETVDRAENLARLVHPLWRDLRESWDSKYPPEHAWHYGTQNVRNFRRDFGIGQASVLGMSKGGLLGIPGEPRTPAQQLELSRSRAAELSRRYPPSRS